MEDPLRKVIAEAMVQSALGETAIGVHLTEHIATAVRAFLGSEEVVETAASAIAKQNDGCEWSQMSERAKQWEIGVARAALSSIGGE